MSDFSSFTVTAGNGSGAALLVPEGNAHTVVVSGQLGQNRGIVVIEGSTDGAAGWVPLATFQKTDFRQVIGAYPYMRVTRRGVPSTGVPAPSVSVGACVEAIATVALTDPVTLNGAGVAVDLSGIAIETVTMLGAFPAGAVISVEISQDGTNWVPLVANCTQGCQHELAAAALWARMRVRGRTSAAALPQVELSGRAATIVASVLTPPATVNGNGASVDVATLDAAKTVSFCSSTGSIPGFVIVQGSNDGGTTWCDVLSSNKPGIAFVAGVFQRMRMVLRGFLDNPDLPTISVGVGAEECGPCPACELGDGESDVSLGGT